MTDTVQAHVTADGIDAEVNYIVDDGVPPVRYVDWPEQEHNTHRASYESRTVRIRNGRCCNETFTLASHGFTFLSHHSAVRDFYDEDEVVRAYYHEPAA